MKLNINESASDNDATYTKEINAFRNYFNKLERGSSEDLDNAYEYDIAISHMGHIVHIPFDAVSVNALKDLFDVVEEEL